MFSIMKIALRNAVASFLIIGGALMFLHYYEPTMQASPSEEGTFTMTPDTTKVERLIKKYDCYTDEAPNPNVIPSKAIVTTKEGKVRVESSHRALSQLFEGVNHGLTVHAFCL